MNFKIDFTWLDEERITYIEHNAEGINVAQYSITSDHTFGAVQDAEIAIQHGPYPRKDVLAYVCKKHGIDPSKVKAKKQNLSPDNPYWDWYSAPYNWKKHLVKYRGLIGKSRIHALEDSLWEYSTADLKKLIKHRERKCHTQRARASEKPTSKKNSRKNSI